MIQLFISLGAAAMVVFTVITWFNCGRDPEFCATALAGDMKYVLIVVGVFTLPLSAGAYVLGLVVLTIKSATDAAS